MGGGGYTINVKETQSAGDYLTSVGDCAKNADDALTGTTVPAPAAGLGIGDQLASFVRQWHVVLPDLKSEMDTMSAKTLSTASVYYTVEEQARSRFQAFAE